MERYQVLKQIGDGTYGAVMKALHRQTQEVVAVKRFKQKFYTWEECVNLREVQALRKLNHHPNIVKLREVIREHNQLYFVFEYMDGDLLHAMKEAALSGQNGLPHAKIRNVTYQTLQAITYMHKLGFMHRDLKPENILLKGDITKLADFGLAKEIRARPPFTEYVSTRWYRAPEVLLQHKAYNSPVDIWAMGCIIAELYTLRPLFPGSSERDEIFKITSVLGSPEAQRVQGWSDGVRLARQIGFTFPQMVPTPLQSLVPNATREAIDIMDKMLVWDPERRPKAAACLSHAYFQVAPPGAGPSDFLLTPQAPKAPTSAPAPHQQAQQDRREQDRSDAQLKPATTGKYKNQIDISPAPKSLPAEGAARAAPPAPLPESDSSDSDFDVTPIARKAPQQPTAAQSPPQPALPPQQAAPPQRVQPAPAASPQAPPWAQSAAPRGSGSELRTSPGAPPLAPLRQLASCGSSGDVISAPHGPGSGDAPFAAPGPRDGAKESSPTRFSSTLSSSGSFTSRARYLPGVVVRTPAKQRRTSQPTTGQHSSQPPPAGAKPLAPVFSRPRQSSLPLVDPAPHHPSGAPSHPPQQAIGGLTGLRRPDYGGAGGLGGADAGGSAPRSAGTRERGAVAGGAGGAQRPSPGQLPGGGGDVHRPFLGGGAGRVTGTGLPRPQWQTYGDGMGDVLSGAAFAKPRSKQGAAGQGRPRQQLPNPDDFDLDF
eukprot:TRINITY_DN17165_c0_g2_i1.p1 TRINITY_DN17165_c0_g2~~TRINITY_DN17165_c0_g2_i1.p1  ORF type:complete len:711 (+),score=196.00 TRINITY_DN17165_c0_g2_i1:212-2344(+)